WNDRLPEPRPAPAPPERPGRRGRGRRPGAARGELLRLPAGAGVDDGGCGLGPGPGGYPFQGAISSTSVDPRAGRSRDAHRMFAFGDQPPLAWGLVWTTGTGPGGLGWRLPAGIPRTPPDSGRESPSRTPAAPPPSSPWSSRSLRTSPGSPTPSLPPPPGRVRHAGPPGSPSARCSPPPPRRNPTAPLRDRPTCRPHIARPE